MSAVAVEYEAVGATAAQGRGLPAVRADVRHLPIVDSSADLVVAFDLLEHVVEDDQVLCEVSRVLRPGGWFFVAVPADMALWSAHDEAVGHVRRYTRDGLTDLVASAGLHVDDVWSWNVLARPVVVRRRKSLEGSHLVAPNAVMNKLLSTVIVSERGLPWLRRRPGVSLMLTAQKGSPRT
jgi:SAM-dependent methyltransferase